jgi:hypothetical protein
MTPEKQLFWSTVFFIVAWAIRLALRYLVTIRPELKRLDLVRRWETVIALLNQRRKEYATNFPKDKDGMPRPNIMTNLAELCEQFDVNAVDVTAHRRKMKDNELPWTTLGEDDAGPIRGYSLEVKTEMAEDPAPEGD